MGEVHGGHHPDPAMFNVPQPDPIVCRHPSTSTQRVLRTIVFVRTRAVLTLTLYVK